MYYRPCRRVQELWLNHGWITHTLTIQIRFRTAGKQTQCINSSWDSSTESPTVPSNSKKLNSNHVSPRILEAKAAQHFPAFELYIRVHPVIKSRKMCLELEFDPWETNSQGSGSTSEAALVIADMRCSRAPLQADTCWHWFWLIFSPSKKSGCWETHK